MLDGLYMTLEVSMLSLLFATLWGSVICILRMSRNRWLRAPAGIYIELMRSLPLLVLLLVSFYVIFAATALTKVQVSVVCFALYFGAYFAEIFRTGITGVEKGQWEAGAALGMNKRQVFGKIVLPQALLNILPVFRTQTTALIKATSIVGYISVMDITKAGDYRDYIRSRTFDAFFPLLLVAAIYLILSWIFGTGIDAIQHRLTPKSHRL